MTVHELRQLLSAFADDDLVVLSKDAEGNAFSPLSGVEEGSYRAATTWCGDVGLRRLTPALQEQGFAEDDVVDGVDACYSGPPIKQDDAMSWLNTPVGSIDRNGFSVVVREHVFCSNERCSHATHPERGVVVSEVPSGTKLVAINFDDALCFVRLKVVSL